jgi:uncharacterized protein
MAYTKPLPAYDVNNKQYWDAAKAHKLVLQKCQDCGNIQHAPAGMCSNCLSENLEWITASGKGKVWSFNVFHQVYWPSFKESVPYNVVYVELEEGPMMISSLEGIRNEDIKMDMAVEVTFDDITEEWTLPRFKPAE